MCVGRLVGAIVLFVLSIGCIAHTVVEMARGEYGMGSGRLWGAVAFHAVTAILASLLLHSACGKVALEGGQSTEDSPPETEPDDGEEVQS